MTTLIIIAIVIAFIAIPAMAVEKRSKKTIKRLTEESEAYKKVAEDLELRYDDLRERYARDEADAVLIQADYYTSESDSFKYSSDEKMYRAIKSKLSMLIGNDIAKKFEPSVLPLGEGKQKYSLVLKVKKI